MEPMKAKPVTKGDVPACGFVHLLENNSALGLARVGFGFS